MQSTLVSLPSRRGNVRRAVEMLCSVRSDLWQGALPLDARDLSPDGLWLSSRFALEPGEKLVLAFRPPRWPQGTRAVVAQGEVVRVELRRRRSDAGAAGMGVRFVDLKDGDHERLHGALRGLPPPLPVRRRDPRVFADPEMTFDVEGAAVTFRSAGTMLTVCRPVTEGSRASQLDLPPALQLAS